MVVDTTVDGPADEDSELAERVTVLSDAETEAEAEAEAEVDEVADELDEVSLFWRRTLSV
jgi:hypothetical protein